MQQQLVVPAAHALLADMVLRRARKRAAAAGKWTCPDCQTRTISANAPLCAACAKLREAIAEAQRLAALVAATEIPKET